MNDSDGEYGRIYVCVCVSLLCTQYTYLFIALLKKNNDCEYSVRVEVNKLAKVCVCVCVRENVKKENE